MERINEGNIDEQTLSNLMNISKEAKRLSDLAANTLRLTQLSDYGDAGAYEPINLSELTDQIASLFRPMARKAGRHLTWRLEDDPTPVLASVDALTRLLWNLLDNALVHGRYGVIEITVTAQAQEVRLTVKDNGAGIPPEMLPKVFERGVSSRKDGTGLGLHMCRSIARELGGTIIVGSSPGKGTVCVLTLPRHQQQEEGLTVL